MSGQSEKAFEVKWCVENLKSWLHRREDALYSPQFLAETLTNTRWKLRLSWKCHLAEKYICLALQRDIEDDNLNPINLNYELSFVASDGSALRSKSCTTKFAPKTAGIDLNVKEVEIFEEKKEAFLPEGVLTVCCKMWKVWSTSKRICCSIRTVLGRKCVTLDGTIDHYSSLLNNIKLTANFMSTSEIGFISFDASITQLHNKFKFENGEMECKGLKCHSCKLLVLDASGQKLEYFDSTRLAFLFGSNKSYEYHSENTYHAFKSSLKNDTLYLQSEITYSPAVESENIKYYDKSDEKMTNQSVNLENKNTPSLGKVLSPPLNSPHQAKHEEIPSDIEKNKSSDEDDCFDPAGQRHLPSTTLKEDLISLFNERLFCDTQLRTDTETFPAHRNVLSARSPVFKKMFTTDMKEKAGECINIPDISSDAVRRMLQFLYTDCTGDLDLQSAKDLYIASDKYDIASLKRRCTSFMKKNLCPANVCEIIVLADMHQDKDLESAAHEFVLTYDKEVLGSDEWKLFMKNFAPLAAQVMYLKCMKD